MKISLYYIMFPILTTPHTLVNPRLLRKNTLKSISTKSVSQEMCESSGHRKTYGHVSWRVNESQSSVRWFFIQSIQLKRSTHDRHPHVLPIQLF